MKIGIPKELKNNEFRVAITVTGVDLLVKNGHDVFVETGAGNGSGFTDEQYVEAGATIVQIAAQAWDVDIVLKVKEPIEEEYGYFKEGLILFTFLHLAPEPILTKALMNAKVTAIAYETVQLPDGSLPLLMPMSEVAGKMATQVGAHYLEKVSGGKGILLGGVSGVERAKVTVIGGGIAGMNAARIAVGIGAAVTIIDNNAERLRVLDQLFGHAVQTMMSNPLTIAECVKQSDLVIGSVLIPGAAAPKLVTEEMIRSMAPGSVVVDIAIDQGGCFETSEMVTTHERPTFVKHGVIHYTVANMPGAVPRTATIALTNNTMSYVLLIANEGIKACLDHEPLKRGINTIQGHVVYKAVAKAQNIDYTPVDDVLEEYTGLI